MSDIITTIKQHKLAFEGFVVWFEELKNDGGVPMVCLGTAKLPAFVNWPFEMQGLYLVKFLREQHQFTMSISQLNDERLMGMIEVGFTEVEKKLNK